MHITIKVYFFSIFSSSLLLLLHNSFGNPFERNFLFVLFLVNFVIKVLKSWWLTLYKANKQRDHRENSRTILKYSSQQITEGNRYLHVPQIRDVQDLRKKCQLEIRLNGFRRNHTKKKKKFFIIIIIFIIKYLQSIKRYII